MTYRRETIDLLNANPDLAGDPDAVAEHVGCTSRSAERYIGCWEMTRDIEWALPRAARTRMCDGCSNRTVCEVLDALELPVMCERVPVGDVELAQLRGMEEYLVANRGA